MGCHNEIGSGRKAVAQSTTARGTLVGEHEYECTPPLAVEEMEDPDGSNMVSLTTDGILNEVESLRDFLQIFQVRRKTLELKISLGESDIERRHGEISKTRRKNSCIW